MRHLGYAYENGEHIAGRRQLAAPVTGPDGETLAAIGVASSEPLDLRGISNSVCAAGRAASYSLARGAGRYPLERGIVYRLLATYGLEPIDAQL